MSSRHINHLLSLLWDICIVCTRCRANSVNRHKLNWWRLYHDLLHVLSAANELNLVGCDLRTTQRLRQSHRLFLHPCQQVYSACSCLQLFLWQLYTELLPLCHSKDMYIWWSTHTMIFRPPVSCKLTLMSADILQLDHLFMVSEGCYLFL